MSKIGKVPIKVPGDVKVKVETGQVYLEGPKGKLQLNIANGINVALKDEHLTITRTSNTKQNRADHGTVRARLASIIQGVTTGHKKDLEIQGIGFRANLQGKKIVFNLGLSHPVEFEVPSSVKVSVPNQTSITVEGHDKVQVGQVAARIRALKPVEPYKGKGIRYVGEVVRRKQGKSVTK